MSEKYDWLDDTKGWAIARTIAAADRLRELLVDSAPGAPSETPKRSGTTKVIEDDDDDEHDPDNGNDCDCNSCRDDRDVEKKSAWRPFRRKIWASWSGGGSNVFDDDPYVPPTRKNQIWRMPFARHSGGDENQWLPMILDRPVLRKPKWAKGAGNSDVGSVFRAPHRLMTDQRVFRMNRAKRSGSLLLDASGSMGVTQEHVERIVKAIPAAVIGMYSSDGSAQGVVRVLAKYGMLVTRSEAYQPYGGGNGVDGPGLRWLAVQPRPRVWISDGGVTGIGDRPAVNLYNECLDLCERYRIVRVGTLAAARRLL